MKGVWEDEEDNDGFSLGDIDELSSNAELTNIEDRESHTGRTIFLVLIVLILAGGGVLYYLQHTGKVDISQIPGLRAFSESPQEDNTIPESNSVLPETEQAAAETAAAAIEPEPEPEPILPKLPDPAPVSAVTSRENIELGIARATIIRAEQMVKAATLDETEPLLKAIESQKAVLTEQDQTRYAQITDTKERYQTMIEQSKKAQRKMQCDAIKSLIEPLQDDEQAMRDILSKQLEKCQYTERSAPATVD